MKNRIISLMTAIIMVMTVFVIPMASTNVYAGSDTSSTTKISISKATVSISQPNYIFTKKQIKPAVTVKLSGKKLVNGRDYTVKYSQNIYPGTGKITVTGIGKYKNTVTKTFGIAKPIGVKWVYSTPSSIKLDWTSARNVTGYKVYRYSYTKGKWSLVKTVSSSEAVVKNLAAGTGYTFCIQSYYKKGGKTYYSPKSSIINVPTRPKQVTISNVINHPSLYVKAQWGKQKSTGYQIRIATNSAFKNAKTYNVKKPEALKATLYGLQDNKKYYIQVRAYREYAGKTARGTWSKSKSFVTDGTRWYTLGGKKYYYKNGKKVTGTMKMGGNQYFFNYEDGAWSGVSSKMWNKVKNSSSKTKYLIAVSRQLNRICVYEGSKGKWKIKYFWKCSTGAPKNGSVSRTPAGSWLMPKEDNHLKYIGGHEDYTCWYATRFYNRCFFHSVLYEPASMKDIQDGRLGMNISDGCIRMDIENAKWIYSHCHTGTRVIVY